jgi:hypothetical protein
VKTWSVREVGWVAMGHKAEVGQRDEVIDRLTIAWWWIVNLIDSTHSWGWDKVIGLFKSSRNAPLRLCLSRMMHEVPRIDPSREIAGNGGFWCSTMPCQRK